MNIFCVAKLQYLLWYFKVVAFLKQDFVVGMIKYTQLLTIVETPK